MLTKTSKILPNTRGDIFQITFPQNDEKHEKSALMDILQVFGTLSDVDCQSVFRNGTLYKGVSRSFSESAISEIH